MENSCWCWLGQVRVRERAQKYPHKEVQLFSDFLKFPIFFLQYCFLVLRSKKKKKNTIKWDNLQSADIIQQARLDSQHVHNMEKNAMIFELCIASPQ